MEGTRVYTWICSREGGEQKTLFRIFLFFAIQQKRFFPRIKGSGARGGIDMSTNELGKRGGGDD